MKESEIKALLSLLDDTDRDVYDMVELKILSLGSSIIPHLEAEWESNLNIDVQERIENLIHAVQYGSLQESLHNWSVSNDQDLLEGASLISTYLFPEVDFDTVKEKLEQLYYECWLHIKDDMGPVDKVKAINYVLFQKFHFTANTKNFHSPMNSMLNYVVESKKGNPISLSIIYLLIAKKLDLPIRGVNLPNLFVVSYLDGEDTFYVNVFNKGVIFSRADIENYIDQLKLEHRPEFYEPCSSKDIIVRSLRNLIVSFEKVGDEEKVEELRTLLGLLID